MSHLAPPPLSREVSHRNLGLKRSRATRGVSQLQLRVSRYTMQLSCRGATLSVCVAAGLREKSVHNHHRKKIFWRTFLASRKTFQAGGGYKNPIKTRKTISTTEIFPLWTPFFRQKKVLHWSRAVYAFFFPGTCSTKVRKSEWKQLLSPNVLQKMLGNYLAAMCLPLATTLLAD